MTSEQEIIRIRPLESYFQLMNETFKPRLSVSTDLLEDSQRSLSFISTVDAILTSLDERIDAVLVLRFGLLDGHPQTFEQIGATLPRLRGGGIGVDKETVRQLVAKGQRRLRHPNQYRQLLQFLTENPDTD